jgi:SAM-dependent methyltransferase
MSELQAMDTTVSPAVLMGDPVEEVVAKLASPAAEGERWLAGYAKRKVRMDRLYQLVLPLIPPRVKILDLGCGLGLLGMLLDARGQGNETHGIEWDLPKARFAGRMAEGNASIRVVCGDFLTEPWPKCSVVTVLDVLHYLAPERQRALLFRIGAHLPEGGRLLLRVMDGRAGGMARLTRMCEQLAVAFGWNRAPRIHWLPLPEVHGNVRDAGLEILPAPRGVGPSFGNHLLVAEKRGTGPHAFFGPGFV